MKRRRAPRPAGSRRGAGAVAVAVTILVAGCAGSPLSHRDGAAPEAPADPCAAVTAEQRERLGLATQSSEPRRSTTERLSFSSCMLAEGAQPGASGSSSPTVATGAMRIRVDRVGGAGTDDASDRFEEACEDGRRALGNDSRRSRAGEPGDARANGKPDDPTELGDEVCVLTADRPAAVVVVRKGSDVVAVQTYSTTDEDTVRTESQRVAAQVLELL
jgi:hypothetical protein